MKRLVVIVLLVLACSASAQWVTLANQQLAMLGAASDSTTPVAWYTFSDTNQVGKADIGPDLEVYAPSGVTVTIDNGAMQIITTTNNIGGGLVSTNNSIIDVDVYNAFTITGWYKRNSYSSFYSSSGYLGGSLLMFSSINYALTMGSKQSDPILSITGFWHFLAVRVDKNESTYNWWFNGTKKTNNIVGFSGANENVYIGNVRYRRAATTYIDDFRLYDRVLTDEQINDIRLEGRQ
jgi:hypothetical protein